MKASQIGLMFFVGIGVGLLNLNAHAETWPGFRGHAGTGVSPDKNLPTEWSAKKNITWSVELFGRGNSSPCITSDRVYLTTKNVSKTERVPLYVMSIDRKSGKMLWRTKVGEGNLEAKGPKNLYVSRHNSATPTASADEKHVWAFFGTGLLVCLDRAGEIQWSRNLAEEYGSYDITFGMGSSPRLWGDLLYVACMTKGTSYVVALNKATGKQVWKANRQFPAKDDGPDSYSTPFVYEHEGGNQLLVSGCDHINAYDPKTGDQIWSSDGLTITSKFGRVIASPTASDNLIVATSGNPGGGGLGRSIGIRPGGKGDISQSHRLWKYEKTSPDSSSPIIYKDLLYLMSHEGIASCVSPKTGELVWRERLGKGDAPYYASLVAGGGKVYFLSRDGRCTVVQAGPNAKVLAENQLPEDGYFATPAISDGTIYIRGHKHLYAIGGK